MHQVKLLRWNTNYGQEKGFWEIIFTYSGVSEIKIKKELLNNSDPQMDFYKYETPFGQIFTSHVWLFDTP